MREFARNFVPLAILVVAVAGFFAWLVADARASRELQALQHSTEVAVASVTEHLSPLLLHLQSLAREADVVAALDHPDAEPELDRMAAAFTTLIQRNPTYAQVRWIDESGRERVRVNAGGAERPPERVPHSELQAKKSRYFVREGLALSVGTIQLSELDLKVEHDRVELPKRQMLRATIRVDARDGRSAGLIVMNVDGNAVLEAVTQYQPRSDARQLLVNQRGDFLRGLTEEDEFAFMFKRSASLATASRRCGSRWRSAMRVASAAVAHLWAWRTLDPIPSDAMPGTRRNATPWFVLARLPADALWSAWSSAVVATAGIALVVLAMLALLCYRIAREKALLGAATERAEGAARAKAVFLANMS